MSFSGCLGIVGPLPPPAGGMATQTQQLSEFMAAEGVTVILVQTNKAYRPAFVQNIKGLRALFRLIPYLYAVWRLAGRADVIHLMANSGWSWQLFSAPVLWIGWLRKTAVIVNYRGGEAQTYFSKSYRWVKPSLSRAAHIIVPSNYLKKIFTGFGVKTYVIPNIINFARFKPSEDTAESDVYKLIITRNLEPIYGIDTAIKAIAAVFEEIPNIQLSIAGSGPQRVELEQLVTDLGLQDIVNFVGRLDSKQIVDFYHSADVMLNPTTVDNMPNSVLEALACGVPVVTTNVGGIPYIVEHEKTALLVPVADEHAMAEQIVRLYRDRVLNANLITNGLETVKPYAWSEVKQQWLSTYSDLNGFTSRKGDLS